MKMCVASFGMSPEDVQKKCFRLSNVPPAKCTSLSRLKREGNVLRSVRRTIDDHDCERNEYKNLLNECHFVPLLPGRNAEPSCPFVRGTGHGVHLRRLLK